MEADSGGLSTWTREDQREPRVKVHHFSYYFCEDSFKVKLMRRQKNMRQTTQNSYL